MARALRVGVIGDYCAGLRSHEATNEAIQHAAAALGVSVETRWLPTQTLDAPAAARSLAAFDSFWAASGGPYRCYEGALNAIRYARENLKPFFGT